MCGFVGIEADGGDQDGRGWELEDGSWRECSLGILVEGKLKSMAWIPLCLSVLEEARVGQWGKSDVERGKERMTRMAVSRNMRA